jgi:hypothetical protein
MAKRALVAALIAAGFMLGAAVGWLMHERRAERDEGLVAAVHAVEVAGLCANALGATESGRAAAAQKLLEMRMVTAVNEAADRVVNASAPNFAIPNLLEGLKRARLYAAAKGMPQVVGECDRVLEFLMKSNARA